MEKIGFADGTSIRLKLRSFGLAIIFHKHSLDPLEQLRVQHYGPLEGLYLGNLLWKCGHPWLASKISIMIAYFIIWLSCSSLKFGWMMMRAINCLPVIRPCFIMIFHIMLILSLGWTQLSLRDLLKLFWVHSLLGWHRCIICLTATNFLWLQCHRGRLCLGNGLLLSSSILCNSLFHHHCLSWREVFVVSNAQLGEVELM